MTAAPKAKAIAFLEDCQRIHQEWADWQRDTPDWRDQVTSESPGDEAHHRKWVKQYDYVLKILRAM